MWFNKYKIRRLNKIKKPQEAPHLFIPFLSTSLLLLSQDNPIICEHLTEHWSLNRATVKSEMDECAHAFLYAPPWKRKDKIRPQELFFNRFLCCLFFCSSSFSEEGLSQQLLLQHCYASESSGFVPLLKIYIYSFRKLLQFKKWTDG